VAGGILAAHATSCAIPSGVRYARFVRFWFLILIGRFATLEGMKIKSVTPMHHAMSMDSPAVAAGGGLALGGCRNLEQGL
jgi:hypothetical protein